MKKKNEEKNFYEQNKQNKLNRLKVFNVNKNVNKGVKKCKYLYVHTKITENIKINRAPKISLRLPPFLLRLCPCL